MTGEDTEAGEPLQLPMAPGQIRQAALVELERTSELVQGLDEADWTRASAVTGWTVGDVVAHLDLVFGLYQRLLSAVSAGRGSGPVWKTLGQIGKSAVPFASPAINALNSAVPRLMDRALSRDVIKGQFASGTRGLREKLEGLDSHDYTRPVYYVGGPWPLSFFLGQVVNELAIHGWDIASAKDPQALLGENARQVLPWFYWSGTAFMLRPPAGTSGTIEVRLANPNAEMWWSLGAAGTKQGAGEAPYRADATIFGQSGTFVLALSGRISPLDALRFSTFEVTGSEDLARTFLGSWKIV